MAHTDDSLEVKLPEQGRRGRRLPLSRAVALTLSLLLVAAVASGCGQKADTPTTEAPAAVEEPEATETTEAPGEGVAEGEGNAGSPEKGTKPACPEAAPTEADTKDLKGKTVVMETSQGKVEFEFFPEEAPIHVAAFIKLAECGFYDGTKFHRVGPTTEAPDMVQGGDPNTKTGEGQPGQGGPGYTLPAEFNDHKHVDGTLAMARSQNPDSAGSQFYIAKSELTFLDGQYTVFGQVTKGLDVVHTLSVGDSITKVTVKQAGK